MAQSLQELFERKHAIAQRHGWPCPPGLPHKPSQQDKLSWIKYWQALQRRADKEGWYPQKPS